MSANNHNGAGADTSIVRVAFNLIAACFISGLVIGAVYYVTAPVAAQKAEMIKQESMRELIADADDFAEVAGHDGWTAAIKNGKPIAYIVPGETKGYGGKIKLLVAVDVNGKVLDFSLLEHNETPGLGDNAQKPEFRRQFAGKDAAALIVVKDPANKNNIQAMTGATITSRAVTKGVKEAAEKVAEFVAQGGK